MAETSYLIQGMTCDHCARSISEEVEEVAGVAAVSIDREAGLMTVTAEAEVASDEITAAVAEAGNYTATLQG